MSLKWFPKDRKKRNEEDGLLLEQLVELVHPPLMNLRFTKRLSKGHIGQLSLSFLYLKQARLYRILHHEFDGSYRVLLTQPMLKRNRIP